MSPRDNLWRAKVKKDCPQEGVWCQRVISEINDKFPEGLDGHVRQTHNTITFVEPLDEKMFRLLVYTNNNPGGSIPTALANTQTDKLTALFMDNFEKALEKFAK